ncbi:MAG: pyruvate ferredoxin oxidoreductase [Spirochaetes bacterium]|nr:pyruvate ferredoxin oxidoreductase [Spirochaetota bacterium]
MVAVKTIRKSLTGAQAAAEAMKQVDVDVVAAYPITPQTPIVQEYAQFVADGIVNTEMIQVESEHSAMSAVIGAAASGARATTATSAQGLAYMWEMVGIASTLRLPIVMNIVNRALSGPLNIHCDHSDAMSIRDLGWIMLFSENPQEVYYNNILAFRIAEDPRVFLPVAVNQDGFITSHCVEAVDVFEDEFVKKFVGDYKYPYTLLDFENPISVGEWAMPSHYFEFRVSVQKAIEDSVPVIEEIFDKFYQETGVKFDFFEGYRVEDADIVFISMGSTSGTVRYVVDRMRSKGGKVGSINVRVFRPFRIDKLLNIIPNAKYLVVMDRSLSFGTTGSPLYQDITSGLYSKDRCLLVNNYVYGLGGRDITDTDIEEVYEHALYSMSEGISGQVVYVGLNPSFVKK